MAALEVSGVERVSKKAISVESNFFSRTVEAGTLQTAIGAVDAWEKKLSGLLKASAALYDVWSKALASAAPLVYSRSASEALGAAWPPNVGRAASATGVARTEDPHDVPIAAAGTRATQSETRRDRAADTQRQDMPLNAAPIGPDVLDAFNQLVRRDVELESRRRWFSSGLPDGGASRIGEPEYVAGGVDARPAPLPNIAKEFISQHFGIKELHDRIQEAIATGNTANDRRQAMDEQRAAAQKMLDEQRKAADQLAKIDAKIDELGRIPAEFQ